MSHGEPTEIGKYRILGQIGEGAMGVVYRAHDVVLNRSVAIKVMNDAVARDKNLRGRFLREAQSAGSLQHPNVVTVYDFGEVDGRLFIAMEFVAGADLSQVLDDKRPLTVVEKLDVLIDLLNGLAYAHKRGIVHRDVKPANIRIDEEGRARIMDFGIAHLSSSTMTRTGTTVGTPAYMSPEQVTGGEITAASDVFSAGVVMYELFSGVPPFSGESLHTVLYKIVSEEPAPLTFEDSALPANQRDGIHQTIIAILERALAKDPNARFVNAREMASALTNVRARLVSSSSIDTTVVQPTVRTKAMRTPTHRRQTFLAAAALAAVVLSGGVGFAISKWPSKTTAPSSQSTAEVRPTPAAPLSESKPEAKREPKPTTITPPIKPAERIASAPPKQASPEKPEPQPESPDDAETYRRLKRRAADARTHAIDAGVSTREILSGDFHVRAAAALERNERVAEAVERLNQAIALWEGAVERAENGASRGSVGRGRPLGRRRPML